MRMNIQIDDALVDEASSLTGVRSIQELVHLALSELVRVRKKKDLLELAGKVDLHTGFDHKEMRRLREDAD